MKHKFTDIILRILKSRKFYIFSLIFFVFEASWIALSAAYPQAFDENFHFGLIKIYSHIINPILTSQPKGGDPYGAVARDPSFLYHYLMSWPYRVIAHFVHTQIYQVVILRFINIILFGFGLIYFHKLLLKLKLSTALTNLSLFLFILIPIVPQLAGQINYDNLLFLMIPIIFLEAIKVADLIKKGIVDFPKIAELMILCTFTALVKYAFLPIYLGIVFFFLVLTYIKYRPNLKDFFTKLGNSFSQTRWLLKIILLILIIISVGMFAERDLYNLIAYGSIEPSCSHALNIESCKQYPVWFANYKRHNDVLSHKSKASTNIIAYAGEWIYWMWYRLFFAINGPNQNFINYPPLPLPSAAAALVGISGLILVIKYRKKIFKENMYYLLIIMPVLIYLIALFIQGYVTYKYTAVLENMNGRYLIPILFLIIVIYGKAFSYFLKNSPFLKTVIVAIVILMFLNGGGIGTYIIRSNDSWYITSHKVQKINKIAKKLTKKIVITGKKTYKTKVWFFN
jgi:hypothetical protein